MPGAKRVLIVDDNQEIVSATRMRLAAAGHVAIAAFDGQQGVDAALVARPDAILLDVRMPVKDGLQALRELRSRAETRDIPVVMLSASVIDQQAALDAGARYFVRKPYEGRRLVEVLETVLTA